MAQQTEARLYLDKAGLALQQAKDNLEWGYYDVAASRAYYAMFYAASALLVSKGISRGKHAGVHSAFGEYFVKPGLIEPQYSRMLVNAFNVRLDSDYDVRLSLDKALAEDILSDARQFVERAVAYFEQEETS